MTTGTRTRSAEAGLSPVAVLGTLNLDRLLLPGSGDGRVVDSAGGLAYSLGALTRLRPAWTVLPVAWLPAEPSDVYAALAAWPGILSYGWCAWPGEGNEVRLDCRSPDKPEHAILRVPPLTGDQLAPALDCARVLLNCTSGRDVALADWRAFVRAWRARHPRGWLQLDWHSLSLDWEPGRPRRLRRVPDAFAWLDGLDLLQLTLAECASMTARPPQRLEEAADFALRVRKAGCRRVVVTDGANGLLYLDAAGPRRQPAQVVDNLVDTTGCGDVLGATLLATLAVGWPAEAALAEAVRQAARVCQGVGLASLDFLSPLQNL